MDFLFQLVQKNFGPGELGGKNRQPDRHDYDRGSGQKNIAAPTQSTLTPTIAITILRTILYGLFSKILFNTIFSNNETDQSDQRK